jgi:hypothetical protein
MAPRSRLRKLLNELYLHVDAGTFGGILYPAVLAALGDAGDMESRAIDVVFVPPRTLRVGARAGMTGGTAGRSSSHQPTKPMRMMIMRYLFALALAAAFAVGGVSYAQTMHGQHGMTTPSDSEATKAFKAANAKMHAAMDIKFSGDADVDFIKGMIPHHQGAIDMAEVVLKHGKDEQTRKWATDIIREQKREIAEMQAWLKAKGQ